MLVEEDCSNEMSLETCAASPKESLIKTGSPSHKTSCYEDLAFMKIISNERFPIFLVYIKEKEKYCAMKLFPTQGSKRHFSYKNEIRFAALAHPNIIKTYFYEQNRTINSNNTIFTASFILTEFAPYGDFFDFVSNYNKYLTDKLIRTYFRQFIEGLEYLHKKKIAHLDLKLENLFLGEDFTLKIADFDLSCSLNDSVILSQGTKNFRAPEILKETCQNPLSADIYSAGIILFVLKSGGTIPYAENVSPNSTNLLDLLHNNNAEFWKVQCKIQNKPSSHFSPEFRELFNGMTKEKPKERFTIQDIKKSAWYNGSIMTADQLKRLLEPIVKLKHI